MVHRSAEEVRVLRLRPDLSVESCHTIKNGSCDCEGFHFRKKCSHLDMAESEIQGTAMPLILARRVVERFILSLGYACTFDQKEWTIDKGRVLKAVVHAKWNREPLTFKGTVQGLLLRAEFTKI